MRWESKNRWRRGFFRLWIFSAAIWIAVMTVFIHGHNGFRGYEIEDTRTLSTVALQFLYAAILPPLVLLGLCVGATWIAVGFLKPPKDSADR